MENSETLYNKIVRYLKLKIESGEVQPNEKLPTEAELAKLFGVSRITSKRALQELEKQQLIIRRRGSGSYVGPPQKIIPVLKKRPSHVVALAIPYDISNIRLLEILKGATSLFRHNGYLLTVLNTGSDPEDERKLFGYDYHNFCGIIYYPNYTIKSLDLIYHLYLNRYPLVTIDKYLPDVPVSYVTSDNVEGARQSASYLIQLGHRNIGFMLASDLTAASSVRQRFFGYCTALHEHGIPLREDFVRLPAGPEEMENLIRTWIDKGVTAIQTENDDVAIQIIHACEKLQIAIPEKLSLIGYDNRVTDRFIKPTLTTVEQNYYAIGKQAAKLLLSQMNACKLPQSQCLIPSKLIVRESCSKRETAGE